MFRPELLMPAGNFEIAKTAYRYGADAVYVGGDVYNLRAKAQNFSMQDLDACVKYAHGIEKKVYVTVNIYARHADLSDISDYLKQLADIAPDALIIADPGVFSLAKQYAPNIPIHISTQANTTNAAAVKFWQSLGAARVILAREMTLKEIAAVKDELHDDIALEAFVHGSMCMAQSGRCLLSAYLSNKSANSGECTHPCRWRYQLVEEKRPDIPMPVVESPQGTFLLSANDLCMIEHVPALISAGIDCFKVEGRMKNALYVATIARAYKIAIDAALKSREAFEAVIDYCRAETNKCTHREYTTGFYLGNGKWSDVVKAPVADTPVTKEYLPQANSDVGAAWIYVGTVGTETLGNAKRLIQKNKFHVGDVIEILKLSGDNMITTIVSIRNDAGMLCDSAPHAKEALWVEFGVPPEAGDVIRMETK